MSTHIELINKMIEYFVGDPKRIQHFLKVFEFAKLIGEMEDLDKDTMFILETSSIVHDIGIKVCEQKYGSCSGKYQELEGPPIAESMLKALDYNLTDIERVSYLIAHHHTYKDIKDLDLQILVEADFLVNAYEDSYSNELIKKVYNNIFKTKSGKNLFCKIFNI